MLCVGVEVSAGVSGAVGEGAAGVVLVVIVAKVVEGEASSFEVEEGVGFRGLNGVVSVDCANDHDGSRTVRIMMGEGKGRFSQAPWRDILGSAHSFRVPKDERGLQGRICDPLVSISYIRSVVARYTADAESR